MSSIVEMEHATQLAAHLLEQRKEGKYCDVCVCVDDKKFLAHKCILSANSSKLDSLISDACGAGAGSQDIEIDIQGVSSVGFETLLEYFYSGNLNLKSTTVMPVWMTAAYLELPVVVNLCNKFCQHSVTSNTSQRTEPKKITKKSKNPKKLPVEVIITNETTSSSGSSQNIDSASENEMLQCEEIDTSTWTPLQNATAEDLQFVQPSIEFDKALNISSTSSDKQVAKNKTRTPKRPKNNTAESPIIIKRFLSSSSIGESPEFQTGGCKDMMLEVERLRIQHEQLQKLQQQQAYHNLLSASKPVDSPLNKTQKTKRPRNAVVKAVKEENVLPKEVEPYDPSQPMIEPGSAETQPLDQSREVKEKDFRLVSPQQCDELRQKYSIDWVKPLQVNCTASELLLRGKSRGRKSAAHNTLNNTIRFTLDRMDITESNDPNVEDALILIMDRFEPLRFCINDPIIRRNLLVKVRHSIHCKKWRLKNRNLKKIDTGTAFTKDQKIQRRVKVDADDDSLHG